MPYIDQDARTHIENCVVPLGAELNGPGELNFAVTSLVLSYLGLMPADSDWERTGKPRYRNFNEVVGAIECVKLELYRRAIAPYENEKRDQNGEVY